MKSNLCLALGLLAFTAGAAGPAVSRAAEAAEAATRAGQPATAQVTPLERLLAIEEIRNLKARYFRLLDTKQWDRWGMTFARDAVMRVDSEVSTWGGDPHTSIGATGRERIRELVRNLRHETVTVHQGHTAEIEITSPTTARAIWLLEDIVDSPAVYRRSHGHYHETYEKVDGVWYIKTLHLTRLRIEELSRTRPLGGDASLSVR